VRLGCRGAVQCPLALARTRSERSALSEPGCFWVPPLTGAEATSPHGPGPRLTSGPLAQGQVRAGCPHYVHPEVHVIDSRAPREALPCGKNTIGQSGRSRRLQALAAT